MGLEEHKKDYVIEAVNGRRWQVGSRDGLVHRVGPNRWLGYASMSWRGADWQLGHVGYELPASRHELSY